jgi:hypothetical protein
MRPPVRRRIIASNQIEGGCGVDFLNDCSTFSSGFVDPFTTYRMIKAAGYGHKEGYEGEDMKSIRVPHPTVLTPENSGKCSSDSASSLLCQFGSFPLIKTDYCHEFSQTQFSDNEATPN